MPTIDVFVRFLAGGWKWPLRAGDTLELWSAQAELCGTIDAALLLDLLAVYLRSADLTKRLADAVTTPERSPVRLPPAAPERKPLAPPVAPRNATRDQRDQLRARRRERQK